MNFDDLLNQYRNNFPEFGSLVLGRHDNARATFKLKGVPSKWGVYLIYCEINGEKLCLYIGKAGGPGIKRPGIFERLTVGKSEIGTQRVGRPIWFKHLMDTYGVENLIFDWIVTIDSNGLAENPVIVEQNLLSAYSYSYQGRRPPHNK